MTSDGITAVLDGVAEGLDITPSETLLDEIELGTILDTQRNWLGNDVPEKVAGLFDGLTDRWVRFRVQARFLDIVCGGTPNDPKIIEAWLASKAGVKDSEELQQMVARTLLQTRGIDLDKMPTLEEMDKIMAEVAEQKHQCVFKRDALGGLYLESRQLKAGIRESTNILFATNTQKERFGVTRKSPKSFVAERLFVVEGRLYFQPRRDRADRVYTFTGHIPSPQGDRSALTRYEVVLQPSIEFHLAVVTDPRTGKLDDDLNEERIITILSHFEQNGIGALRSQGTGRFKITSLDRIEPRAEYTVAHAAKKIGTVAVDEVPTS